MDSHLASSSVLRSEGSLLDLAERHSECILSSILRPKTWPLSQIFALDREREDDYQVEEGQAPGFHFSPHGLLLSDRRNHELGSK